MKKLLSFFVAFVMVNYFSIVTVSALNMTDCGYKHRKAKRRSNIRFCPHKINAC